MNVDNLRKLIDTYNPASSQRTAESVDAHHKLALLAHSYLLPAIESLEKVLHVAEMWANGAPWDAQDPDFRDGGAGALDDARAVLAKLEDAL